MTCAMAHMELGMLKLGDVCNMYGLDLNKILKDLAKLKWLNTNHQIMNQTQAISLAQAI